MIVDVGEPALLEQRAYDADGVLTAATTALSLTAPDGTISAPTVTTVSAGIYQASPTITAAGLWRYAWSMTGAVVGIVTGQLTARAARPLVASIAELRDQLNRDDTTDDEELRSYLLTATGMVERLLGGPVGVQTFTERHYLSGDDMIHPRRRPLVAVTSITPVDADALTAGDDYYADTDLSVVMLTGERSDTVDLVYTAGLATPDEDIKIAGLIIAQHLWATQQGSGGGGRFYPGGGMDDTPITPGMGYALPHRAVQLLRPHMPVWIS